MPTYDYLCGECGHRFEEFQSMSSKPLRTCPSCRKKALQRLIGAGAGVIFKGSGFYQTDYKQTGSGKPSSGPQESGGCSPQCGTDGAPAGCKLAPKTGSGGS